MAKKRQFKRCDPLKYKIEPKRARIFWFVWEDIATHPVPGWRRVHKELPEQALCFSVGWTIATDKNNIYCAVDIGTWRSDARKAVDCNGRFFFPRKAILLMLELPITEEMFAYDADKSTVLEMYQSMEADTPIEVL